MNNRSALKTEPPCRFVLAMGLFLFWTVSVQAGSKKRSPYPKLEIFSQVLSLIEQHHVDDIDEEELVVGAIRGLLRTLDPHSSWFPRRQFFMLQEDTQGQFVGIGVEVSIRNDQLTVVAPMPDSPAMAAGVRTGDIIRRIDGTTTAGMDLEEASGMIRGAAGTSVTLTLVREGVVKPFDVSIRRERIVFQTVRSQMQASNLLHLEIRSFSEGTAATVRRHLATARRESGSVSGIVLDLRGNPGGLLDEAIRVSDVFLRSGTLVSIRGRGGEVSETVEARRPGTLSEDIPMVLLIDGGSASAAEIVAGALQDRGRALVLGNRSFGKGSVQTLIPLPDGSGLKLTTALYYTPRGRNIQDLGISPDIELAPRTETDDPEADEALSRALEILGEMVSGVERSGAAK